MSKKETISGKDAGWLIGGGSITIGDFCWNVATNRISNWSILGILGFVVLLIGLIVFVRILHDVSRQHGDSVKLIEKYQAIVGQKPLLRGGFSVWCLLSWTK